MKQTAELLLDARTRAPCPGVALDAWLLAILLVALAPAEADCLDLLLTGEPRDGWVDTPDLAGALGGTLYQVGATLSDLRTMGLVETDYEISETGRVARHRPVAWIVAAARYRVEQRRAMLRAALSEVRQQ